MSQDPTRDGMTGLDLSAVKSGEFFEFEEPGKSQKGVNPRNTATQATNPNKYNQTCGAGTAQYLTMFEGRGCGLWTW